MAFVMLGGFQILYLLTFECHFCYDLYLPLWLVVHYKEDKRMTWKDNLNCYVEPSLRQQRVSSFLVSSAASNINDMSKKIMQIDLSIMPCISQCSTVFSDEKQVGTFFLIVPGFLLINSRELWYRICLRIAQNIVAFLLVLDLAAALKLH